MIRFFGLPDGEGGSFTDLGTLFVTPEFESLEPPPGTDTAMFFGCDEKYTSVPRFVLNASLHIRYIVVSRNAIGPRLPYALLRLKHTLLTLDMNHNKLTELPHWIDQFLVLDSIEMERNNLVRLPASLGRMSCLRHLSLYGNEQLNHRFHNVHLLPIDFTKRSIGQFYSRDARAAVLTALSAGSRLHRDLQRLVLECLLRESGSPE
jgi:hypothetical protein